MLRRKLALYTLLYIAGITAGFFMFEKSRISEAVGFCAALISAVIFTFQSSSASLRDGKRGDLQVLLLLFFVGILLFYVRFQDYHSEAACIRGGTECLRGRVISVSVKNEKVRMQIINLDDGPSKVLLTFNKEAVGRTFTQPDSTDADTSYASVYDRTGMIVEAKGEFADIPSADNPGCFDYNLYMKSKGIAVQFKAFYAVFEEDEPSFRFGFKRYLIRTREDFIEYFDDETKGFIRGVIFGDKSEIDEELLDEFNLNSTGHILAVSGLHIGFLYGLLRYLTSRKRTFFVSALIISVILLYGEMTMWSPATVRACIVMTISLLSVHLRRRADLLTSVSLAAFIILSFEPYQLFNSGFLLSFLALCGIAFLSGPVSSVTGEALGVMIAVQLGTLPVIAASYCRINPLSVFINVPVILLASLLVPVCIVLLFAEAIAGNVPQALTDFAELISYAVIRINHVMSFDGGFSVKTAGPGSAAVIFLYIIIFGLSSEWARVMLLRKKPSTVIRQGILLLMPVMMLSACLFDPLSDDEIVFVAVGQGDCVHVRSGSHDVLLDGGGQTAYGDDESNAYNVGKNILMPYLLHSGTDNIDMALVTHLHSDHYKGITELSEIYPVGAIGIPADYRDAAAEFATAETILIKPDTKVDVSDDVFIETVWPVEISDESFAADDPNEHNAVYMINYKGLKIMVTGDLLEEDEREMIDYYSGTETLKCDVLKVAHHGSKSSSSEEFLDAASPEIAVIQCGRNNLYGHPHKQTLERLEKRGIKVYRTDLNGAVGIDIHRNSLYADVFKCEAVSGF